MMDVNRLIRWRKRQDRAFAAVGMIATAIGVLALAALLVKLAIDGLPYLSLKFFSSFPSELFPARAGILPAISCGYWPMARISA